MTWWVPHSPLGGHPILLHPPWWALTGTSLPVAGSGARRKFTAAAREPWEELYDLKACAWMFVRKIVDQVPEDELPKALTDGRWIWLAGKSVRAIHLVLVKESGEMKKKIIVHADDDGFYRVYTMGSGRWHKMTSTAFFALL